MTEVRTRRLVASTARGSRERGAFRRFALAASVVVLPLQDHLPPVFGFSIMYFAFALLALTALLSQPGALLRSALNRVFMTGFALLLVTFFVEATHQNPTFLWWGRMAQMVAGGVIIAALIRSERDINAMLTGVVLAGAWVSYIIAKGAYAVIASAGAVGFAEASELRAWVLGGIGLKANWNTLAFICVAAAGVAVVRAVMAERRARFLYAAAALASVFSVFLTFSRSGVAALLITLAYVFYTLLNRRVFWRVTGIVAAGALLVTLAVPPVVFERFTFSLAPDAYGRRESRAAIYIIALNELPSYGARGVGEGNYWQTWAADHGLHDGTETMGAHNSPLQMLFYWGVLGFVCWMALQVAAWRTLARTSSQNLQRMALKAFCLSVFLLSLTSHDIADKELSMALGLIVGAFHVNRVQAIRAWRTRKVHAARLRSPDAPLALRSS